MILKTLYCYRFLKVIFQYLSVHSPVFKTIFFGEFSEKGKDEVVIKDLVYEVTFFFISTINIFLPGISRSSECDLLESAEDHR